MATFQINDDEWYALSGLPHLAREVYFVLRRYMDFQTGITGAKRKVSLKAITEELYVEPHQGINEFQPSQMQVRRSLEWLEKAGLIERNRSNNKTNKQSIFKLVLATRDYSAQNKADSNPTIIPDSNPTKAEAPNYKGIEENGTSKADNAKIAKADMPPISDIKTTSTTSDPRQKFRMRLDWTPDNKSLKALQLNAGIPHITIPIDYIQEFRGFWSGRIDLEKTDHEWTHILVTRFKQSTNYERGRANANRYSNSQQPAKESLVERVSRRLEDWANS